jgi:hypothetical protein
MKKKIIDIYSYFQGNIRYWLYYNMPYLIRPHILKQINYRIEVMNKDCYTKGSCVMCGCNTTMLQMADKQCSKPCYPPMLNKKQTRIFFSTGIIKIKNKTYELETRFLKS